MGKPHKLKLILPEPCAEDWDKMTAGERGRFCGSCNKPVIDFSKYTDRDLFDFFVKTKEHICGRFNSLQLNRTIAIYEPGDTSILKRVLFGAALTAGVAGTAKGQNAAPNQTQQVQNPGDTTKKVTGQTIHKKHTTQKHPPKPVDPPPLMGAPMRVVDDKKDTLHGLR